MANEDLGIDQEDKDQDHGRSWTHFSGGAEHSVPMKYFVSDG